MSTQLAFEFNDPRVIAVPRPNGLREVDIYGTTYIVDDGYAHPYRVLGWYYGYPACCVEGFIERWERGQAGFREWLDRQPWDAPIRGTDDDPCPEFEPRPIHPVSGHLLCDACEVGPPAPLPPRPAERYGFIRAPTMFKPANLVAPSTYDSNGGDK